MDIELPNFDFWKEEDKQKIEQPIIKKEQLTKPKAQNPEYVIPQQIPNEFTHLEERLPQQQTLLEK